MKFSPWVTLVPVMVATVACGGEGPTFSSEHPRIYLPTQRDRLAANLDTAAGMRWKSAVDRWVGGSDQFGFQAWNAALLGQLTGDGKYCAAAVKAIDAEVRAASAKIASGAAPDIAGDSYLQVGDRIGDLALVYDWCFDVVGDRRSDWLGYAQQTVFNVWHHTEATWGSKKIPWDGWATDDPSDNYYYSFLRATMLVGLAAHDDFTGAGEWLVEFHDDHLMKELVPTFDAQLVGGGSREGTGYGVSLRGLFELYDLWAASTGETIATKTSHTRASLLQFVHSVVPTLDRVAPTGDHSRDSTAALFDYHRDYAQELIALFPDDPVAPRAQALLAASSVKQMGEQFMFAYDFLHPGVAPTQLDGLGTAYYAPGIGQLYARSSWDTHATWINLIAGAYTQSHAHQDQGSILIYKDGWLAYDPNIESHSGLRQETESHSLVRVVDANKTLAQKLGTTSTLVALHKGDGFVHAAADLAPAYKGNAAIQKLEREIVYLQPDCIVVYDRVTTRSGSSQVWQLATPVSPSINGTRTTVAAAHTLSIERVQPAQATAAVHRYADDSDFTGGFRLDETVPGGDQRFLHVLWIDGAVGTVTPVADGVTLTLGGTTATVTFRRDAIGGSLTIGANTTTLGPGLDTLAE